MTKSTTWSTDDAMQLSRIAHNLLTRHDCNGDRTNMARENCGACMLNGYHDAQFARDEQTDIQPNYAGWARVYVEAGKTIPAKYRAAFISELDEENRAYAEALRTDVRTFGLKIA